MKNSIPLGFIRIFILLICLTSCGSKKQQKVALPADFKGPKELARLYGVRITPEDNIFLYNEGARWLGVRHKLCLSDNQSGMEVTAGFSMSTTF